MVAVFCLKLLTIRAWKINVGAKIGEGVNYGIDAMGKGVEYVNDALNSNQLEIYKEPKKNITHEDIYNKLISSDIQGLNQIYTSRDFLK